MIKHVFALATIAGAALGSLLSTTASAQTFDHLKCYKMKDSHNFAAAADLTPLQNPPFPIEPGCKIKVKGRELCIPVDKALLPGGNAPSAPVTGQPLQNDYVCYVLKCPKVTPPIPPVLVSDQFGSRTLQKFVAHRICTPAIKGLPPTTTTTMPPTTTLPPSPCTLDQAGACVGTCPNTGDTCLFDPATGACDCGPQSSQCTYDSVNGVCAGLCPHSNDLCLPDPSGAPPCFCQPLPACQFATFPACNGTCPGSKLCEKDPTTSFCYCCGVLGSTCVNTSECCGGFTCIGGTCQ